MASAATARVTRRSGPGAGSAFRSGKPSLKFSKPLAALLKRRGIADVHVSLTDEIGTACAFVVVEGAAPKARRER